MGALLDKAIEFAVKAHAGSFRKGTSIPYIVHPLEAAAIAATMTADEEVLAAAVLHDTVEDTDVTKEEIQKLFGTRVAGYVAGESEDKMEDRPAADTWIERKQATIDLLDNTTREEQILVLADKLSNIRAIDRDYDILGEELWERFNQKDKKMHAWYYMSIAQKLDRLTDCAAYKEYLAHIKEVFFYDEDIMLVRPEVFYEKELKDKTAKQIQRSIRKLKKEIKDMRAFAEEPEHYEKREQYPAPATILGMNKIYLSLAKKALMDVGGQYIPTAAERKAEGFNEHLLSVKKIIFSIGGFFNGYASYSYDFREGKVIFSAAHSSIKDPSNKPYEVFEKDPDSLIRELQDINIGEWKRHYIDYGVCDGTQWSLTIKYDDNTETEFEGSNLYPWNFQELLDALGLGENVHGQWERDIP